MLFDWDDNKREKVLRDHGIDFLDAMDVWDDLLRQERLDLRHDYGEDRIQTIGKTRLGVLFVVYTERFTHDGDDITRLISARLAERDEIDQYHTRTFERATDYG